MPETEATAADPTESIYITHEITEGVGICTRGQFDIVWAPKGWTIVDPENVVSVATPDGEALRVKSSPAPHDPDDVPVDGDINSAGWPTA